jgi:hypothetical protein
MSLDIEQGQSRKFWEQEVTVGRTVFLSDRQAMEDALKENKNIEPIEYIIEEIQTIKNEDLGVTWKIFKMDRIKEILWLLVKMVGEEVDLRVYFRPEAFTPGDREEMFEKDQLYIFGAPEDEEDYEIEDLEFASVMELDGFDYNQKAVGGLPGIVDYAPADEVMDGQVVFLTEYMAEDLECESPEAIILEYGGEGSETGGFIDFLLGSSISVEDLELL